MKDLQKVALSNGVTNTNDINIDINWDELPDTPYGTLGNIPFHDTTGQIDVNGGGQLQYTLPIALPPGIKSVAPQINLVYTSGSGNGIAGYGWSLSGITSISRMGKTLEKDGEIKGVQLDYSDYYQFNGQRLILKSGEYGKDGAEYVTEKYSNVKIKSVGVNPEQNGPVYFEVTFEDGSQAWYGLNADGRTPIEYNITRWQDAQGNYISYNYIQGNNVAVIYTIEWGGNEIAGTSHFNNIVFNYITREVREISYVNGKEFIQANILSSITVNANGNLFKKYSLTYKKDDKGNKYQFVESITESNSKGENSNPVTFGYQESKSDVWKLSYTKDDKDTGLLYGDFDGDGKLDILKYEDASMECLEYKTVWVPYNNSYDERDGFYENHCVRERPRSGGLYLYSSIFDDNKPETVYVGSLGITKELFKKAKAVNLKTLDGELLPKQGFVTYKSLFPEGLGGKKDLEFKAYAINIKDDGKELTEVFTKVVPGSSYDRSIPRPIPQHGVNRYWVETYIEDGVEEIDLDGDGLSELIFRLRDTYFWEEYDPTSNDHLPTERSETRYRYLIVQLGETDPNKMASSLSIGPYYDDDFFKTAKRGDFNGDGIVDFLHFDGSGRPYLATFKKDASGAFYMDSNLYPNMVIEGLRADAVVGDFTGDGKTDILVPQAVDSWNWKLYISTGNGFRVQNLNSFALFKKNYDIGFTNIQRKYYVQDLNKDGKADFFEFYSYAHNNASGSEKNSKFLIIYHENRGMDANGNIVFEEKNIDGHSEIDPRVKTALYASYEYPFAYTIQANGNYDNKFTSVSPYAKSDIFGHFEPAIGDFRINNFNENILLLQPGRLIKYSHYKVSDEARITSIVQGSLTTNIDYLELDPNVNKGFYGKVERVQYPYIEMDKVSQSYAVLGLRQEGRKQDFKYRGFVAHLQGKGMIGFRRSARSSWYADGYENTKVWTGTEIDPLREGVPVKEWTIRTIDNNDKIFPDDLSVNNTTLLSFKSTEYEMATISAGVNVIIPKKTITKDFLKDITEENSIIYGDYYLPTEITKKVNNDFAVTTTVIEYLHNSGGLGKDYFIGRPKSKTETVAAYGDTKSVKEEYTYENNQVKTHKVYNRDNTGWIEDTFEYDIFGNIIQSTVSNSVDAMIRTEKSQYDTKGCFVLKKTDNLGLETIIEYNDWGQVKIQTDPLGNTLNNTYDAWGKLIVSKTNLGGVTTYTFEKLTDGSTKVIEYAPDATPKETYTDKLGRHYKTRSRGFNGEAYSVSVPGSGLDVYYPAETDTYLSVSTQYDILGRKTAESEPYLDQETPKWNMISYDDSVFPPVVKATAYNGKLMKTTVTGNTTIIEELNGNERTTKKTTDALDNVTSSEDKGGVIHFSFNASNQQTSAQYGNNTVTTKYDIWGRKIEFHDPSNGLYTYDYNGFGQITKETSPKGYKEYVYNVKGQLISQVEKSNTTGLTDKNISFTYNEKGQPKSKSGISNGKTYSTNLIYDAYGRLLENTENSNGKIYSQKNIIYDKLARVVSYEKSIVSSGITTKASIENVYDIWSGILSQVKDKATGKVLWRLQAAGADGRVMRAQLGETSISNKFDVDNFLSQTDHISSKGLIFGSSYVFDSIKNELKERTRLGNISRRETFIYDDNNRLVEWTNPKTGGKSFNKYDIQGRIVQNDQVGTYQYQSTNGKMYQYTNVMLNNIGKQNYLNDKIRRVVYNENNDPLYIQGTKGDIRFEYGLTGARQVVTFGAKATGSIDDLAISEWEGTTTKFYSEDGSFEIVQNNATGQEKHILYIGGTPYEANIVLLKQESESISSFKYLHKDYLGSILAISDGEGNLVEETHFDAWGQLVAGSISLLGRGYTSHEHFEDVGIIHMNGRLYDPLLRRFLNADENIQDPYNTQNYNKYSYVLNNPMMYNDPSGEFFFAALFLIFQYIMLAMAMVQLVGMIIQLAIGDLSFGQFLKFMIIQAVSSLVSYGVGELFKAGGFAVKVLGEATAKLAKPVVHALSQGVLSIMRGESFVNGFATALLASVAAGIGLDLGGKERWSRTLGATVGGAIGGGVGSVLSGGNFWQGATTGAIIGYFNDSMHDEEPRRVGNSQEVINPKTGERELSGNIKEVILSKKRVNVLNSPSDYFKTVNKVGTSLDFITVVGGKSLPKTVGVFGKYAGPVATGADVIANITDYSLGNISSYKALYNTTGSVSSYSVGALAGTAGGTGVGFVAGLLPAVEFRVYGELWDFYKPRFVQGYNQMINQIKSSINISRY
ncbi:RHS repeat-associated core domain-containing protein [Elizabethkingia anophelis]|uniref:RHS repeat-associated core domain-containing protein n=1 Tax=Elizabethkingia anophelis TaxID=1117645 RepID=UPI003891ED87